MSFDLDLMSDEEFLGINLNFFAADLAFPQFDALVTKQQKLRTERATSVDNSIFLEIANDAGFDPYESGKTENQKARLGRLKNTVNEAIRDALRGRKGALAPKEQREIMDLVIKNRVKIEKFGPDPERIVGVDVITPEEARRARVPFEDVPPKGRLEIRSLGESVGLDLNEDQIGRIFGMELAGATRKDILEALLRISLLERPTLERFFGGTPASSIRIKEEIEEVE